MAQRHEEETTEFKVETLILCINNCGFTGNPSTKNMCQNCYKASTTVGIIPPLTFSGSQDTTTTNNNNNNNNKSRSSSVVRLQTERSENRRDLTTTTTTTITKTTEEEEKEKKKEGVGSSSTSPEKRRAPEVNRCSGCRRKVGLTGFRCRCGDLFCSEHRYSDRHVCSYDYKAAGRDAIARENPVVKAAKIVRV